MVKDISPISILVKTNDAVFMKKNQHLTFALIASLLILNSCGFTHLKDVAPESSAYTYSIDQIGYKEVNELVLKPNCIECHNQSVHKGSIILDSFVNVKANLGLVQNEVVGQTMPPDGSLPSNQIKLVSDWIKNGAPEFASEVPTPSPTSTPHASPTPVATATPIVTPTPSVLVATYTSIRANIFVPKCLSCHSAGASEKKLPLDNYETMMANSSLIKAGNPNNSTVYIEVSGGTMPPRHRNPVTAEEVAVIKTWIQNGAIK